MSHSKTYLGDGVYAEVVEGMIRLTTENGMAITNTVYLEKEVWDALVAWVTDNDYRRGSGKLA